jgi:hypothetical protein
MHRRAQLELSCLFHEREVLWMVRSLIRMEVVRLFSRWQPWVAFLLLIGVLIQGYEVFYPEPTIKVRDPGWFNVFLAFTKTHGYDLALLSVTLPLIAVMVAGDSLAWDLRTGFMHSILMRMNYKKYIMGKLLSVSLVTFVFVWIGEWIAFIYGMVRYPVLFPPAVSHGSTPDYAQSLFMDHPILYVMLIVFNTSMAAMAFSTISLALSTKIKNLYVVLALPWLGFIVIEFISQVLGSRFSPLNYIGQYFLSVFSYHTLEIPLAWTLLWVISWMTAYLLFVNHFKKGGKHGR